jgi:hypothetical protein
VASVDQPAAVPAKFTVLLAVIGGLYVAAFWQLDGLPFMDLPDHLTRAAVITGLLSPKASDFSDFFEFQLRFAPYLLGDGVLVGLISLFGLQTAGKLWMLMAMLAPPAAMLWLMREYGIRGLRARIGLALSLYLATDWFFLSGYENYRFAFALVLWAIAIWQRFASSGSTRTYVVFVVVVVVTYTMHLSGLVLGAAAIGGLCLQRMAAREISWAKVIASAAPFAVLLGWHFLSGGGESGSGFLWGSVWHKLLRLASGVVRFDIFVELPLFAIFCLVLVLLYAGRAGNGVARQGIEFGMLAGLLLLLYFVMPAEWRGIFDVDNRALPFVFAFAVIGVLSLEPRRSTVLPVALGGALALAAFNLAVLWVHLKPASDTIVAYQQILQNIPARARVLPVATRPDDGRHQSYLHIGALATAEQQALTPYLFSANTKMPMSYFRYRVLPYAPPENWYRVATLVDWARVQSSYDYVVATTPFDPARLAMPLQLVASNRDAVLFRVVRDNSPPAAPPDPSMGGEASFGDPLPKHSVARGATAAASVLRGLGGSGEGTRPD